MTTRIDQQTTANSNYTQLESEDTEVILHVQRETEFFNIQKVSRAIEIGS